MGRVEPQDVLNVYKDGLLSGVREKIVLVDHDNLNALTRVAQVQKTQKGYTDQKPTLDQLNQSLPR